MKKQEYRAWLEGRMKPASIKDRLSRCARVEEALGVDLDEEYKKMAAKESCLCFTTPLTISALAKEFPEVFISKKEQTSISA